MKAKINKNRKPSVSKKLIPAAGSLAISATMLATSTLAWFTMSREVEVKNIQMTATTPEDIQISLGQINKSTSAASDSEDYALNKSTGWLVLDGTEATAPRAAGTANDELDWSNTADISAYYAFGKLIPASSTNGVNVYYTPDASGVGRTVKEDAAYYPAVTAGTANKAGADNATGITNDTSAKATSHIYTTTEKTTADAHTWDDRTDSNSTGYKKSEDYKKTNDDGYYVDIPVWLRTSSTVAQNIYVTGYVTDGNNDDGVLYKAVRVAILDGGTYGAGGAGVTGVNGCVLLKDGASDATYPASKLTATGDNTATSILDSDNYNGRTTSATGVNALNAASASWDAITQNAGDTAVCQLAAGTGQEYGPMSKLIIRVWLEGEDGDCWNANSGQDWNISLKFMKEALLAPSGG